jgi:hypothetical protein
MKRFLLLFIAICLVLTACGRGGINGHTTKTAYRSVKFMKEKLPPETRVEFEVSFWTIRDAKANDDDFLDAVDGKDPFEIIDMAKGIYQERKNTGFKGYDKYNSWEEMIAKFDKERIDQEKQPGSTKRDNSRKNGTILYNLQVPNRQ